MTKCRPSIALSALIAVAMTGGNLEAQRPPAVGTVNPRAVAPPLQQPAPIGGLRTVPLGAPVPEAATRRPYRRLPFGFIPLRVVDAAVIRGGAVVYFDPGTGTTQQWFPSAEPPTWRVDTLAPKVDAWRDLVVDDVICNADAICFERRTRVRARWSALCNCYRFADAMGRIWRVE